MSFSEGKLTLLDNISSPTNQKLKITVGQVNNFHHASYRSTGTTGASLLGGTKTTTVNIHWSMPNKFQDRDGDLFGTQCQVICHLMFIKEILLRTAPLTSETMLIHVFDSGGDLRIYAYKRLF